MILNYNFNIKTCPMCGSKVDYVEEFEEEKYINIKIYCLNSECKFKIVKKVEKK